MQQLQLSKHKLLEIGFKEVCYPAEEFNSEKTVYEITFINGVFSCNP